MFNIELSRSSFRDLENFDSKRQERVYKAIEKIKSNPFQNPNIKKLRGELKGRYRYKVGDIRIIYYVDKVTNTVFVETIGKREEIY